MSDSQFQSTYNQNQFQNDNDGRKILFVDISKYLHRLSIFSINCTENTASVSWQHEINRYANQHSATYIVLLSAYEVVDINS